MPGNSKPRKPKSSPRQPRPQLPDLLRQTHVLCGLTYVPIEQSPNNIGGPALVAFCSCGEPFTVYMDADGPTLETGMSAISSQFMDHRDGH